MNILFSYFPPNLLLALGFGLTVVSIVFLILLSAAIIWFIKLKKPKMSSSKFYLATKLVGVLSIVTIAISANHFMVYLFSTIIAATLITELEFIEKIAAMISKNSDYFHYREKVEKSKAESQEDFDITPEQRESLNSKLQKEKDNYLNLFHFERTYRLIFGSQLSLLDLISKTSEKLVNISVARQIYDSRQWPENFVFDEFLRFLIVTELLEIKNEFCKITSLGEKFLEYLRKENITLKKPF